ncbi:hypothetical protein RchiOBHm_Chr2g0174711 [Rosa chinensis]|uniref:Uncharacterized protein n=1 Tax=Rosa chinensis TaxID=74649 RepID=A0A2P6S684_ROSCH|nr:hypothetical protein RchiOBHm_Chr2g0174711 [Rosa chinensis]
MKLGATQPNLILLFFLHSVFPRLLSSILIDLSTSLLNHSGLGQ